MSPANTTNDSTKAILQDPKYEIMNDILEEVHKKHVRVCKEETKVVNKNFKEVMVIFEMAMKEVDPTFKEIFNRFTYTGSFYEGLKISSPDEYDCNLIIKPKLKMIPLKRNRNCPPGHIAIQVIKDDKCSEKPYKDWLHYDQLSNRYFLKIDSIKSWLQGIVTKAKNKIEREKIIQRYKIDIHQSGPAWTLVLTLTDIKKQVSIDLVPCLEFKDKDWPGVPRKPKKLLKGVGSESWFAVPKGPRNFPKDLEKNKLWNEAWRMSFPIHEKHVLNGFYNLKFIVRLMKQLRDKLKIHKVASYYIKTLFLWEIEKENDNRMWQENGRGHLFIYMLVRFKEALEKENIPFFWEKECNLLEHIPTDYLKNNAGQVKRFIGKVESYIDKKDSAGLREFIDKTLERITVCQVHFPDDCFMSTMKTRLKKHVVPTILSTGSPQTPSQATTNVTVEELATMSGPSIPQSRRSLFSSPTNDPITPITTPQHKKFKSVKGRKQIPGKVTPNKKRILDKLKTQQKLKRKYQQSVRRSRGKKSKTQ